MFLVRVKLIKQGEKRETSTKTCNETMLREKLRVFVSRISPSLPNASFISTSFSSKVKEKVKRILCLISYFCTKMEADDLGLVSPTNRKILCYGQYEVTRDIRSRE